MAAETQRYLEGQPPLLLQAGMSEEDNWRIADWHSGTWFSVRGEEGDVVLANKGARQGCKLGAACFNVAYELALKRARRRLAAEGVELKLKVPARLLVPWASAADDEGGATDASHPADVEYVDDGAFVVEDSDPWAVAHKIGRTIDMVTEEFMRVGLRINFGKDKSAVLAKLFGPGSRKCRQCKFLDAGEEVFTSAAGRRVEVVHSFKHLGSDLQDTGRHLVDARTKASKAQKAFAPLAVPVLGDERIHMATRRTLATSLVFSRQLFGVAAWAGADTCAERHLLAQYMRVLRRVAGAMRFQAGAPTDDEVLQAVGAPALPALVRARRLACLPGLLLRAPPVVVALLAALPKPPSAERLLRDLRAMQRATPALWHLDDPFDNPEAWKRAITEDPQTWKRMAADMKWFRDEETDAWGVATRPSDGPMAPVPATGHGRFATTAAVGLPGEPGRLPAALTPRGTGTAQCPECGKHCKVKGLGAHRKRVHGISVLARRFVSGSVCPACNMDFHTRPRALHHLQFACKQCRGKLMSGQLVELDRSVVDELDRRDRVFLGLHCANRATRTRALLPPRTAAAGA